MAEKDFLYENDLHIIREITKILGLLFFTFPLMLLFIASGQFYLSYRHLSWIFLLSAVLLSVPGVLLRLKAPVSVLKQVTVVVPAMIVGILATEVDVYVYLSFGLGIALSLFFHDKKLTFRTTAATYVIIVISTGVRSFFVNEPQLHFFTATCVGYLIEILAMGYVAIRIADDSRGIMEKMYHAKMTAEDAEKKAVQNEALREEKKVAERANRAKTVFLANMSHEIRTPINAIMGMNEMVLRESREPQILEYAGDIQRAGESLLSIINDILDFSKIESGRLEMSENAYNVQNMLAAVIQMTENKAKEKNLRFLVQVDENLPMELIGDEIRIRQIMVNLLNNAVKYTRKGTVIFAVKGKWEDQKFFLCFSVIDTGIGIREEDKHKLFYVFERLDLKNNRNIEGTGLGLVITQKLVDAMGGRISVESVYGKGSTFQVFLPQKISDSHKMGIFSKDASRTEKRGQSYRELYQAPGARILIVDDNDLNLTVAKNLLKKTKMQITLCHGGEECLEITGEKKFDVILLDHMMPGLDGMETLQILRKSEENPCRGVPVIALTANAMPREREKYLEAGFDDYISKPIRGKQLELLLQKYIPREKIQPVVGAVPARPEQPSGETAIQDQQIFNETMGMTYSGGEKEFYEELLGMFRDAYEEKQTKICALYERKDWHNYAIEVHALKSTSLTLGAETLSLKAKELEYAAKAAAAEERLEENEKFLQEHHGAAMELYRKAAKAADELIQQLQKE